LPRSANDTAAGDRPTAAATSASVADRLLALLGTWLPPRQLKLWRMI
jgi:hypothetical protein